MAKGESLSSSGLVQKIYQLFNEKGLSQAELARRIGMQPSHLNRFLKGHGDMGSARLISLLQELGVDLEQVLNDAIAKARGESETDDSIGLSGLEERALENWVRRLREETLREREIERQPVDRIWG